MKLKKMHLNQKNNYENCGVFGIFSPEKCAEKIFYGIFKLQHRGQKYCGIATYDKNIKLITHEGFVRHTFTPTELNELSGFYGIGHVSLKERQPIVVESKLGNFSLCFAGNIINSEELISKYKNKGHSFFTHTCVELLAHIISEGKDFIEGFKKISKEVKGSYTILILAKEGIYGFRDSHGFKPLIIGKNKNEYAISSESRPFSFFHMEILRDVMPGEVILINENGIKSLGIIERKKESFCAFEWAYIASMDSIIEGVPVAKARNDLGCYLALNDNVEADIVSAIPFSGIGYALGYHKKSGIPYDEVFLIDRFSSRSYLPLTQEEREKEAELKLSVIQINVKGKRIILCDDSIVRGTQIRNKVLELKSFGAKEVHVRIGCPPLIAPCLYDISTRSYEELIAKKYDIKEIAKKIGADTLRYNTIENFIKGIGIPGDKLCLHCWTGEKII